MNYLKYKTASLPYIAVLIVLLLPQRATCQSQDIGIYGTDIFSQGDVALHSGIKLSGTMHWHNSGTVYFRNGAGIDNQSDDTVFAGGGNIYFLSSLPQHISGNPVSTASINLHNPKGLYLNTDLAVTIQASLEEGRVHTGNHTLRIKNASSAALSADMSQYSTRYVHGRLSRLMSPGTEQIFPIGDALTIHPLAIASNGASGYYTAEYVPAPNPTTDCHPSLFYYGYTFSSFFGDGVWHIGTDGEPRFDVDAYHFAPIGYEPLQQQYSLAYNPTEQCSDWTLAGNPNFSSQTYSDTYTDFVRGTGLSRNGYYAILSAPKNELNIVNLIRLDDGSETRFIIPNVWEFQDNSLRIFSRWGTNIFEAQGYDNGFDFKNTPAGTYFYVLSHTATDGKQREVKSFVEVVK